MNKLPYNHDYKLYLCIGLTNAEQTDSTNPSTESSYSQEEWDNLTRKQQEEWLNSETAEWANGYIDMGWSE